MATVFEIERTTGTVYGIRTVNGNCLWFNDRDSRDKRFLEKGLTICQPFFIVKVNRQIAQNLELNFVQFFY